MQTIRRIPRAGWRAVLLAATLIAGVLSLTGAGPAIAQSTRPILAFVVNDAQNPVPIAGVAPRKVSDIVARNYNGQTQTDACGDGLEIFFSGAPPHVLPVPPGHVFMMTGFHWSAAAAPGTLIRARLYVTSGDSSNRRFGPALTAVAPGNHLYSGFQTFPIPVPLLRGEFRHVCVERSDNVSIIGTDGGFAIYGFFARDE